MRFLSLRLPRLSIDRLRRCGRGAPPFAVYARNGKGERLVAVCPAAIALGLARGMAVADARARTPALTLAEADPRADAALLARLADWHRRFTPLVALDPPDGLLLDVAGAAHLFGGEIALMADIEKRLAAQGFAAQTAIAPGPALARALARFSTTRLVAAKATQADIDRIAADLPVAALGLDPAVCATMRRAGLRRVGDLIERPRAPLAARFGAATLNRLDALTCRLRDPITPHFETPNFIVERRFPEGLTQRDAIATTLRRLTGDLCPLLTRAGVGARRVMAVLYRVDGVVKHFEAGAGRPLRDPDRLAALLAIRLDDIIEDGLDTGYGFDVLQLCATAVEACDDRQTALVDPARNNADDPALDDLLDRLGARLGAQRVLRPHLRAAHLPEDAAGLAPTRYTPPSLSTTATEETPPRPLRLFAHPEPIEAMALAPDGPPLRFRWRRALHEIVAYEGPERIAPPWWTNWRGADDNRATRDYFYAQDREGRLFWLFREGLYGESPAPPRWLVQGLS
jgi:protein ImuB